MEIRDCVAVVGGGASGLGAACVEFLVEHGAKVVLLDLNEESGERLASRWDRQTLFCQTDVADEHSVKRAVDRTLDCWGGLQVAINCAGVLGAARLTGSQGPLDPAFYRRLLEINLIGTMNLLAAVADRMRLNRPNAEGERGVIINTSSGAAFEGQIGQTAYSASKAGVAGLTLPAARELARYGIRVAAIAPGLFKTPMVTGMPPDKWAALEELVPFPRRAGHPREFAALAGHIIENPMLNGEVIRLDGALRMGPR